MLKSKLNSKRFTKLILFILLLVLSKKTDIYAQKATDSFWELASKTVAEGDFIGYSDTFHEEAILVNGISGNSYPIQDALDGWQQGFDDTKFGLMEAGVEFRFLDRIISESSAHETGIFKYWSQRDDEEMQIVYVHFEMLLTKEGDEWLVLMEYQKSIATEEEWDTLN